MVKTCTSQCLIDKEQTGKGKWTLISMGTSTVVATEPLDAGWAVGNCLLWIVKATEAALNHPLPYTFSKAPRK